MMRRCLLTVESEAFTGSSHHSLLVLEIVKSNDDRLRTAALNSFVERERWTLSSFDLPAFVSKYPEFISRRT